MRPRAKPGQERKRTLKSICFEPKLKERKQTIHDGGDGDDDDDDDEYNNER